LEEYLAALESGQKPDRDEFLRRYPAVAQPLAECIDGLDFVNAAAPQLRHGLPSQPFGGGPAGADIPSGTPLGDFRILREIGRGGMGVVYEAEQQSLSRRVALKVLPFAATLDPKQLQRFKNEAQAAAYLQHTNIVPVHYVGCERGVHFFAMQYIEGQTLAALIHDLRENVQFPRTNDQRMTNAQCQSTNGRESAAMAQTMIRHSTLGIPWSLGIGHWSFFRTVAQWGIQAAEALEHAHRQGVIHRDIKPGNLLVDARDRLWITDFGLAHCRSHPGLTMTGDLVGTLRYMSPERALGKGATLDARADVYSLGATLYELLTLEPAYNGQNREELLRQIAFEEPCLPRRLNEAVPVDLQTIVLKAMAKSTEGRYATAQELADDLRRFLAGQPVRARPATAWERGVKWVRRRPATAALIAVSVAALLSLLGGTLWHNARLRAALYNSLVSEARATRRARENGYRAEVFPLLKRALELDGSTKNRSELRQEAAACLGDFVGLEPTTWEEFPASLGSAALHPDGTLLAVSLLDGTIQLRHIPDGALVARLVGHSDYVASLAFRAGGKELVSVDGSGKIIFWQASRKGTWEFKKRFLVQRPIALYFPSLAFPFFTTTDTLWASPYSCARFASAALTPDGRYLAASWRNSTVVLVDIVKGTARQFPVPKGEEILALALSPDRKLLAGAYAHKGAYGILVWDVRTRALKKPLVPGLELPYCIGFSPDSKLLVCTHAEGVALYDTSTFGLRPFEHGDLPSGVAFSPDSQLLAYQANNLRSIRLWDLSMNRYTAALTCRNAFWVEFSKDGKTLVAVTPQLVRIWNLAGASEKLVLNGHTAAVSSVVFSPDGKLLATSGRDHKFRIWDPITCTLLKELEFTTGVEGLSFSPDGRVLAAGNCDNGKVRFYDVESWEALTVLLPDVGDVVLTTGFSPYGQYFAAAGTHGLTLWRIVHAERERATKRTLSFHLVGRLTEDRCISICFSPDENWLAWIDNDWAEELYRIHVWDLRSMQPLPMARSCRVKGLGFSPDSKHLTFVNDRLAIAVWDVTTKQETASFGDLSERLEARPATHLSADGAWYAVADQTVAIWDMRGKKLLVALSPERSAVCTVGRSAICSVGWSPDRRLLAVGASDGGLEIWDLPKINANLAEIGLDW
jgi:WD40 repeat protein/serine/threonine protein kinase